MTLDRLTVRELLSSVGSRSPTPGGGAAAAITAALAAAVGEMVVNLSRGKPALAAHDDLHALVPGGAESPVHVVEKRLGQ